MKILEIITEGLGYSTDPEQGKWYHEGRKAFKFGTTGNTIQDIAKKHGCPPEWLKAFHAGYQDQEGWGKGVSESKTAQSPKPRNFVAKNAINTGAGAHKNKKKALKQGNVKHKKKEVAMEDDSNQGAVISQEQLNQMYAKGKPMMFIKNTPVALVPLAKINQIGTPQQVQQVQKALGSVDQTSYTDEYKNKGYVVFQWNGTALDLYVASPEVVSQKYVKFNGQLPQDEKSRGKIPSLVALGKLGIDPSKVPFFVKKVPTQMVSAKQLGLEGKTIQTSWGEQTVSPGGFMVREENGHIYTVAPDAKGLPIGYLRVQESVGEGFGGNDTVQSLVNIRSTVKQILTGKAQYPQGFASQLEIALYDAINALRDNPEQGARNTVNELAELRAIAKQVQTGKATFPQGYTSRLEWVLYDAIKQIENSSQRVAEGRIDEKAKSKAQQKFMGMVYAAKKGEKPASPEVAKAASGMSKKSAKDYAQTKHKGKPEHVKEDGEGGASAGSTTSAMMNIGAVYKNTRAKKQKPGTNALDMKGINLLTGGSIKR